MNIPEITDELLLLLVEKIRPIYHFGSDEEGRYRFVNFDPEDVDFLRNKSFIYDPKPGVVARRLLEIGRFRSLHVYGYHGLFTPSLEEVFAQFPAALVEKAVAFEIKGPETASRLNQEKASLNAGFLPAEIVVYGLNPERSTPPQWDATGYICPVCAGSSKTCTCGPDGPAPPKTFFPEVLPEDQVSPYCDSIKGSGTSSQLPVVAYGLAQGIEWQLNAAHRHLDTVRGALELYEKAWEEMFSQCASNPITDAWGREVPMNFLNEAYQMSSRYLRDNPGPAVKPQPEKANDA